MIICINLRKHVLVSLRRDLDLFYVFSTAPLDYSVAQSIYNPRPTIVKPIEQAFITLEEEKMASVQRFVGYPQAREGPKTPYIHTEDSNPVMRGWTLVVASAL